MAKYNFVVTTFSYLDTMTLLTDFVGMTINSDFISPQTFLISLTNNYHICLTIFPFHECLFLVLTKLF